MIFLKIGLVLGMIGHAVNLWCDRAYELLSGLYHGGNITKLCYFGNGNICRLDIFDLTI